MTELVVNINDWMNVECLRVGPLIWLINDWMICLVFIPFSVFNTDYFPVSKKMVVYVKLFINGIAACRLNWINLWSETKHGVRL